MENHYWLSRAAELEGQNDLLKKEIEILSKSNFDMVREHSRAFGKILDPDSPVTPPEDITIEHIKTTCEALQEVLHRLGFVTEFKLDPVPNFSRNPANTSVNLVLLAKNLADLLSEVYGMASAFGIEMDEVFAKLHQSKMTGSEPEIEAILYPDWIDFHERGGNGL